MDKHLNLRPVAATTPDREDHTSFALPGAGHFVLEAAEESHRPHPIRVVAQTTQKHDASIRIPFWPMEYGPRSADTVLCEGTYLGYDFKIVSHGTHPSAYVAVGGKIVKLANAANCMNATEIPVPVHGGFSFLGSLRKIGDNREFLGWDYAYFGDFTGFMPKKDAKKWTTSEIIQEIIDAINWIEAYPFFVSNGDCVATVVRADDMYSIMANIGGGRWIATQDNGDGTATLFYAKTAHVILDVGFEESTMTVEQQREVCVKVGTEVVREIFDDMISAYSSANAVVVEWYLEDLRDRGRFFYEDENEDGSKREPPKITWLRLAEHCANMAMTRWLIENVGEDSPLLGHLPTVTGKMVEIDDLLQEYKRIVELDRENIRSKEEAIIIEVDLNGNVKPNPLGYIGYTAPTLAVAEARVKYLNAIEEFQQTDLRFRARSA